MASDAQALNRGQTQEERYAEEHLMHDPRPVEELNSMVMEAMRTTNIGYWIVVIVLGLIVGVCLFGAWGYMVYKGIGLAGINRPNYWGVFIVNLVFWIGISHAGTFVSAILRVFNAEYRRPFTRAAELMTTFALAAASLYPLIHLGRVWRVYWMIPYPNQRLLWPNFHSILVWDMIAITTYLIGSTLYLYFPLLPDLAMARDRSTGWRKVIYSVLSLGWRGSEKEWKNLRTAIKIFAFAIIPVMFSVHTIVSWDFAVTMVEGWHSTIFGPFFVAGAIFSGISAVVSVLFIIRSTMKNMDYFIRKEHFDALGKLILIFSMVWTYFYFNEYLLEWYGGDELAQVILEMYNSGPLSWIWFGMILVNIIIPWATLWNKKVRRTPWLMFIISILVNFGMYAERYLIVTGVLQKNRFPFSWGEYQPHLVEYLISIGSIALFLFLYAIASRLIPLIPVWEVKEGQEAHFLRRVGKSLVSGVSETE